MDLGIAGKWALVCAASKGLGRGCAEALAAEGVHVTTWVYPEQHKLRIYSEPRWWHHAPTNPEKMPGNDQVNRTHIFMPLLYGEASELIDQYVQAFEKVWAHRAELGKA